MNDRDPFDPIDRMLDDAFRSRPVPLVSRPSVTDVQRRARRRQQRRSGAMLGALAVVGVGATVALASRDDGHDRTALTPGDGLGAGGGSATTIACFTVGTTTYPPTTVTPTTSPSSEGPATTVGVGTYTISQGETPSIVAQKFDITVDELNAANVNTAGYDAFSVGLEIYIPRGSLPDFAPGTAVSGVYEPSPVPCSPDGGTYHCSDPLGTDASGRPVFGTCEFVPEFLVPTTTSLDNAITVAPGTIAPVTFPGDTTTTYVECPTAASCPAPGFTPSTAQPIVTSLGEVTTLAPIGGEASTTGPTSTTSLP